MLGQDCSFRERRADEATRSAVAWLKCFYMQDRVGEEFDGIVSGVVDFGLFVQLEGMQVDGLLHVSRSAPITSRRDSSGFRMVGRSSGKVFKLGDRLRVRVTNVSLDDRRIDFELAGEFEPPRRHSAARSCAKAAGGDADAAPARRSLAGRRVPWRLQRQVRARRSAAGGGVRATRMPPRRSHAPTESPTASTRCARCSSVQPQRVRAAVAGRGRDAARACRNCAQLAAGRDVPVRETDDAALDRLADGERHQGVVAEIVPRAGDPETQLEEALEAAGGSPPLLLVLDGVTDPHNLGACLRSADAAGVAAVIAPRDRAAGHDAGGAQGGRRCRRNRAVRVGREPGPHAARPESTRASGSSARPTRPSARFTTWT